MKIILIDEERQFNINYPNNKILIIIKMYGHRLYNVRQTKTLKTLINANGILYAGFLKTSVIVEQRLNNNKKQQRVTCSDYHRPLNRLTAGVSIIKQ